MKDLFRKLWRSVPPLRWLDDWTDTRFGENVCYAIIIFAVIVLLYYMAVMGLPRRLP